MMIANILLIAFLTFLTPSNGELKVKGPRSLDDRIAIVGAGPSGVHMALSLKERGFTNVVILEKNSYVGGKSWTIKHRGAAHEMGSVYLAPDYADNVIPLVNKYMPGDLVVLPPASIWLDGQPGPIGYEHYLIMYTMNFFNVTNPREAGGLLRQTIQRYIMIHQQIFGQYEGDLMPEPTAKVKEQVKGTFAEFLKRNDIEALSCILYASSSVQGYGRIDEIPALYGMMWNTPRLMGALLLRLAGKTNETGLYMLKNGFKNLWETIIKKENLQVKFDVRIHSLYRTDDNQEIWMKMKIGKGGNKWHNFDFVIWSPEMKTSLPYWDEVDEEVYYFSRTKPVFFTTALVDTIGARKGSSPIDYWFDNINKKRESSIWAQRDSYAALNQFAGKSYQEGKLPSGNDGQPTRTTVTYQMSDHEPIYTELGNILDESLRKINATSINVLYMKTWRYFPRYSSEDLAEGMLWRILEIQGKYGMWYIGSSVSFESVKSVLEYNKLLLKHYDVPT